MDAGWVAEVGGELVEDGLFEGFFGDGGQVAVAAVVVAGAFVVVVALAFGGGVAACEGGSAAGAVGYAAEGVDGATAFVGGCFSLLVALFVFAVDGLDGVPGLLVYDWFAVVFDDQVAVFEDADVEPVAEEGRVGAFAFVELGCAGDLAVGGPTSAHAPGFLHEGYQVGVRHPLVGDVGFSVSAGGDDHTLTLEATGRGSGHASVVFDEFF